jgi:hypothetical protein
MFSASSLAKLKFWKKDPPKPTGGFDVKYAARQNTDSTFGKYNDAAKQQGGSVESLIKQGQADAAVRKRKSLETIDTMGPKKADSFSTNHSGMSSTSVGTDWNHF